MSQSPDESGKPAGFWFRLLYWFAVSVVDLAILSWVGLIDFFDPVATPGSLRSPFGVSWPIVVGVLVSVVAMAAFEPRIRVFIRRHLLYTRLFPAGGRG